MPEMPEVETIRRTLSDKVTGQTITETEILLARMIKWPSPEVFQAIILGKTIVSLKRRGKYLLFYLDDDHVLVVHLRMTGRFYYIAATSSDEYQRFTRLAFHFADNSALAYADNRTLGTIYLLAESELWRISGLAALGPEPLSEGFSLDYFKGLIKSRKGKIKPMLLNQKLIGGLGNIYADECLLLAGVHPERAASTLTDEEAIKLYNAVNKVIEQGITNGGTTFRDYRDGDGEKGENQNHLYVYGRRGAPCRICKTLIAKIEVAGRGAHYCPKCQPLEE